MRGTRSLHRAASGLSFTVRPSPRQTPLLLTLRAPIKPSTVTPPKVVPLLLRKQFSSKLPPAPSQRDVKLEKELAKQKLEPHPEQVTTKSTIPGYVEGNSASSGDSGASKGSELVSDLVSRSPTSTSNSDLSQLTCSAAHHRRYALTQKRTSRTLCAWPCWYSPILSDLLWDAISCLGPQHRREPPDFLKQLSGLQGDSHPLASSTRADPGGLWSGDHLVSWCHTLGPRICREIPLTSTNPLSIWPGCGSPYVGLAHNLHAS